MQKIIALVVSISVMCLLSGCFLVPVALVGGGVVGGMAISEDTVETEFDRSYEQVWNASVKVLAEAGAIETKDKEIGRIRAFVPKSKVTVRVQRLTASTVRIQVKARKSAGVLPDINMSHRIAYRIVTALEEAARPETPKAVK